jgi:hypothetical protein
MILFLFIDANFNILGVLGFWGFGFLGGVFIDQG